MDKINKNEIDWKKELSPELYRIAREKGTEVPFTGKYYDSKESGVYKCMVCGNELFSSKTKFDSGTGWPSFSDSMGKGIEIKKDESLAMTRSEVICNRCGAHLGHVFDDGPMPTGKRYCINSVCLDLEKEHKNEQS